MLLLGISIYILLLLNIIDDDAFRRSTFAIIDDEFMSTTKYFHWIQNELIDEVAFLLVWIGGITYGFSKRKNEDEYISKTRLESLAWATYFNTFLLIASTIFIYGVSYLQVIFINLFSFLLFFILRFEYKLFLINKLGSDDE